MSEQTTDLLAAGDRIERLLEDLGSVVDPAARTKIELLMNTAVELYGATIRRMLEIVFEAPDGELLIDRLAEDDLVASMLILHDLHPHDLDTRIERALESVRPYLGSHKGDVEYLGVTEEGVVHLRLKGSCEGCPSSTVTLRMAIEKAIYEAAPEVTKIEADGAQEAEPVEPSTGGLLQIGIGPPQPVESHSNGGASHWIRVAEIGDLVAGSMAVKDLDGGRVLFCKLDDSVLAYRDLCPACARNLEGGALVGEVLSCPWCGETYDVRRAGRALGAGRAGSLHLAPLPLLEDDGVIEVAVPG